MVTVGVATERGSESGDSGGVKMGSMRGCGTRELGIKWCVMRGWVMRGCVGHLVSRSDGLVEVRLSGSIHRGRVDKWRHHLRVTPVRNVVIHECSAGLVGVESLRHIDRQRRRGH